MRKKYETLDHTADIGLKIYGKNLRQLFENAAAGLFSLLSDIDSVAPRKEYKVKIKAPDKEELLVSWLRELLYKAVGKNILLRRFKINKIDETSLEAVCLGEPFDMKKHTLRSEVKAVTYYQLKIRKTAAGFKAQVIFDV